MTAVTVAERMSAKEFLGLSKHSDSTWLELVEGEVVVNDPQPLHNYVQFDLALILGNWSQEKQERGRIFLPIDIALDDRNVYKPDVLWYAESRVPTRSQRSPVLVPDVAVEVRSPSTWRYDIGAKKSAYERHGLKELWLVDTQADVVLAFRRSSPGTPAFDVALEFDREQQLTSPLLPGFTLNLAELFPER